MFHRSRRQSSRGSALCQTLVVLALLVILFGIAWQGQVWVKARAELTRLASRASHLGTALCLYYQEHKEFPDAYPARLDRDLRPFVDETEDFVAPTPPDATPLEGDACALLNSSYVRPLEGGGDRYVLSLNSTCDKDRGVVLYTDGSAEIVDRLAVLHDEQPVGPGASVTGGVFVFASGSSIELSAGTTGQVAYSFRSNDGTPVHVIKHNRGEPGTVLAIARGSDIVEVASSAALTFVRNGLADLALTPDPGGDRIKVTNQLGEVLVDGRIIERNDPESPGQTVEGGDIGINPTGNATFEFVLEKPDGSAITRDDLLASGRSLEYSGPVSRVQFKQTGKGHMGWLTVDGQQFPLEGGELYTITASDMSLHLYNDQKGGSGKAMGHWVLNDISASDARITTGTSDDPVASQTDEGTAAGALRFAEKQGIIQGGCDRAMGRGTPVMKSRWIVATKYR